MITKVTHLARGVQYLYFEPTYKEFWPFSVGLHSCAVKSALTSSSACADSEKRQEIQFTNVGGQSQQSIRKFVGELEEIGTR